MNNVLYDWFSFTSKIDSPQSIIDMLGMSDISFESIKGARGYKDRLYNDNISIHYNGSENQGVWCEMSGQGCRNFETNGHGDYDFLFHQIMSEPEQYNVTRLDVAYDDFENILPLKKLVADTLAEYYVSRLRGGLLEIGFGSKKGTTIQHGSRSSNCLIRIYDKKEERNRQDIESWVRCEIQMRDDNAKNFISLEGDVRQKYFDVLNNYLRYVLPTDDSCVSRSPTVPYWLEFIESFESRSIFSKPGTKYNILNLENYVIGQNGGALDTYIKLVGVDKLQENLKNRKSPLNPKYKKLLEDERYRNNPLVMAEVADDVLG